MKTLVESPGGFIGSVVAAVGAAAFMMRKWMLNDKVEAAGANANVEAYNRVFALLEKAETRANTAELRADGFAKERNEAMQKIGALEEQVRQLTATVQRLERLLDAKQVQ